MANTFRQSVPKLRSDSDYITMWRARIKRAQVRLHHKDRVKAALAADKFLFANPYETADEKDKNKIHINYMLPILEQAFSQSIPRIAPPTVTPNSGAPEGLEEKARQFIRAKFREAEVVLRDRAEDIQWDDAKYGEFIVKTQWLIDSHAANPTQQHDRDLLAGSIQDAMEENLDPEAATISKADIDVAHLDTHGDGFAAHRDNPAALAALELHIAAHEARLTTITVEGAELVRIPVIDYVYDTDVPWPKRTWEAERVQMRVAELRRKGFKNITPANLMPEDKDHQTNDEPFEDIVVNVWHVHDRDTDKWFTFGEKQGQETKSKFLRKEKWPYGTDIYFRKGFRKFSPDALYGAATMSEVMPILNELAIVDFQIRRHVLAHPLPKIGVPKMAGASKVKASIKDPDQMFFEIPKEMAALGGVTIFQTPPIPETLRERRATLIAELQRQAQSDAQDIGVPNPHKITAQESGRRESVSERKSMSRQKVISEMLTWYARTLMKLHRKFATMTTGIKVRTSDGQEFVEIDPRELPPAFDIYVTVDSKTDEEKALHVEMTFTVANFLLGGEGAVSIDEVNEYVLEQTSWPDYERFRIQGQSAGPENVQATMGQQASLPNEQGQVLKMPQNQTFQSAVQAGK